MIVYIKMSEFTMVNIPRVSQTAGNCENMDGHRSLVLLIKASAIPAFHLVRQLINYGQFRS